MALRMCVFLLTLIGFATESMFQSKTLNNLRVMTFNTWETGANVENGLQKIANHILAVNPDVAAIIEVEYQNSLLQLLALLGPEWTGKYYNISHPDTGIVTRHQIIETNETTWDNLWINGGLRAKIRLSSGPVISFWAIHLAYQVYGPYAACSKTVTDPIQLSAAEAYVNGEGTPGRIQNIYSIISDPYFQLDLASSYIEPMFVMGDFNSPSSLDWIPDTNYTHCGWTYSWPVSKEMFLAGFNDAYRNVHPDPKTMPGNTWSTNTKYQDGWMWMIPEPQDRIDLIYYKSPNVKPTDANVYDGTEPILQKPYHYFNDWPSDHASVYADFIFTK